MILSHTRHAFAAFALVATLTLASVGRADEVDDRARSLFQEIPSEVCFDPQVDNPDVFTVIYSGPTPAKLTARIYRFVCFTSAYNVGHVYYMHTELTGLQRVMFAAPAYEVQCVGGAPGFDCEAADISVAGIATLSELLNTVFDPASGTITSLSCWRGLCDAFDAGVWAFESGRFLLRSFDVDALYDGATRPIRILEYQ